MQTLQRAPQRANPFQLCSQCRNASTTKKHKNIQTLKTVEKSLSERASILRERVRDARIARREDWMLGPIAPNRAAADDQYGCMTTTELNGVKKSGMVKMSRGPYVAKGMSWGQNMIEAGDRVVVIAEDGPASRERGKVGRVTEVRRSEEEVIVEDLNQVDVKIPPHILATEPSSPPLRTVPLPLPLSSIRLIYPLTTTRLLPTGRTETFIQDHIIEKLVRRPGHKGRYIFNSDKLSSPWIEIPKNPAYKKEKKEHKAHDADTLRFEVEDPTWTPTLLRAPMPGGAIDELRGKYSKFRTRHDPLYQLAMDNREKRKAEYKAWAKSGGDMLNSPAKEARAREVAALREKGRPGLEESVLEKIGQVMASKGIELTDERMKEVEKNLASQGMKEEDGNTIEDLDLRDAEEDLENAMEKLGVDEIIYEEEAEGNERRV